MTGPISTPPLNVTPLIVATDQKKVTEEKAEKKAEQRTGTLAHLNKSVENSINTELPPGAQQVIIVKKKIETAKLTQNLPQPLKVEAQLKDQLNAHLSKVAKGIETAAQTTLIRATDEVLMDDEDDALLETPPSSPLPARVVDDDEDDSLFFDTSPDSPLPARVVEEEDEDIFASLDDSPESPDSTLPPLDSPPARPAAAGAAQQVQVQQVAADPAAALTKVQNLAANIPDDKSTQDILKNMLNMLKNNGYTSIDIQADLEKGAGSGGVQVEPFTLPDEPGKIFYRIKATYTLKAKDPSGADLPPISFSRTISTGGSNPEVAIKIAVGFKENIKRLALQSAGLGDPLANVKDEFLGAAMSSRSFHFGFGHSAGKTTNLEYIQVTSGDRVVKHTVTPDSQKKFVYDLKQKEYQEVDPKVKESDLLPGQVLMGSEEEALLQKEGYSIKSNPLLYQELQSHEGLFKFHLQQIQDDIKKKEAEFAEVKTAFIKEPFLKWLKTHSTDKSKQVLKDAMAYQAVQNDKVLTDQELEKISPSMKYFRDISVSLKELQPANEQHQKGLEFVTDIAQRLQADANLVLNAVEAKSLNDALNYYAQFDAQPITIYLSKPPLSNIAALQTIIKQMFEETSAEIEEKQEELAALQDNISTEQISFNKNLNHLHKLNGELERHVQYLEELRSGADSVAKTSTNGTEKTTAKASVKTLDKEIKRLKGQVNGYKKSIALVMHKVEKYGNKMNADAPEDYVAFDE